MRNYRGVIIEESLKDKGVLRNVKVLKTEVEKVTKQSNTPYLKKWTLHTVAIKEDDADEIADRISKSLDPKHSWYADFKNERWHYIVYRGKIFKVDRRSKAQYEKATEYGISLGIPSYQVDFSPLVKTWERTGAKASEEERMLRIARRFYAKLPKFPDGRIDYTDSEVAPVMDVFVLHEGKILLLKRSNGVGYYKGMWSAVSGYIDELKPVGEMALKELREELGIERADIGEIKTGRDFRLRDRRIGKTWIICPVLVSLKGRLSIRLNWESAEYRWVRPGELKDFDTFPGLLQSLKALL